MIWQIPFTEYALRMDSEGIEIRKWRKCRICGAAVFFPWKGLCESCAIRVGA